MSKTEVNHTPSLLEPDVGLAIDHGERTPEVTDETNALIREAKRRQRRRWAVVTGIIVLAIALIAVGLHLSGRGPNGRSVLGAHRTATPSQAVQPHRNNGVSTGASYPPAQSMGLTGGTLTWATTGNSLEISSDGGSTWRSVTPPNVTGVTVSIHITALEAVGTENLWAVLEDVPGLVPFGQSVNGSVRGQGIDRSTDGGRTWTFVALPGCLQVCGPISLSVVDASHGFAATSPLSGDSTLFTTQDGGVTWTPVTSMPNLGSAAVGGPIAQPQLVFTSTVNGWAVTGPPDTGTLNEPTTHSGALYRTTDGGLLWTRAPGLPSNLQYTLPVFFGMQQGVTVATSGSNSIRDAAAYVTGDGGETWTRHALPDVPGAGFSPGSLQTRFSAVGPLSWRIDVGSQVHETNDGGRTWKTLRPAPKMALGAVSSVAFWSPTDGMAIADLPWCSPSSIQGTSEAVCYPTLIITSDGGLRWRPAQF